ncbi:uncharacterized protein PHALS_08950 [Plasmopara halstedii]|uniref:Uncharacterized protein n=1 Tax=Plasmopara halstedii TaxID=4781 RepID=A0A0P1AD73_PLAHL|nr:uncharacterized protein PHALS_08950 [Plasmopara halstedii]CEG38904.1 hypothetical protein PHALS_08950 [Plasmopara halstedii]|eukprot:XP_024575273.1 hypothetical protein PHALS_08950 [Plasmopara halstedii]
MARLNMPRWRSEFHKRDFFAMESVAVRMIRYNIKDWNNLKERILPENGFCS